MITIEQLQEALAEQANDNIVHKPHRLLSEILFEKGWITNGQVLQVLDELSSVEEDLKDFTK